MLRLFVVLGLVFFGHGSLVALAQDSQEPKAVLPSAWFGTWRGQITSQTQEGTGANFQMQLDIVRVSAERATWKITYRGDQGESVRDYQLVADPKQAGQFVIDEGNGIRIAASLLGDTLHSHFSIAGQTLWTRYKLHQATAPSIEFELVSANEKDPVTSGGQDGVPQVASLVPTSRQSGLLARVDAPASATSDKVEPLAQWKKLNAEPYRGKQDDVYFVNEQIGWYANGAGKIFKTTDGGATWIKQLDQPGTYFRCLGFIDEQHGFAGNIGPGYFPNVTDSNPLYETHDGGQTWQAVKSIEGQPVVGLCALQVLKEEFVNAGKLDYKIRVIGVGRVGGPTAMIVSDDLGATWQQLDISQQAAMAFDVHFFNRREGFLAAATDVDVASSNGSILRTSDGGKTWETVYRSKRPYELTWKMAFPSKNIGYVTLQSYNPDPQAAERFVVKTTDGGKTWAEVPLVKNAAVREFGIAFMDEKIGWVGAVPHGFLTKDGGQSWSKATLGNAVNKIRLLQQADKTVGFAIGSEVHKIEVTHEKS